MVNFKEPDLKQDDESHDECKDSSIISSGESLHSQGTLEGPDLKHHPNKKEVRDLKPVRNHYTMVPKRSCLKLVPSEPVVAEKISRRSESMPDLCAISFRSQQSEDSCASLSSSSESESKKVAVEFGSIEIRRHRLVLGDHPDCSYGPPVQLDWECDEASLQHVDDYELTRLPRRHKSNLAINYYQRKQLLMHDLGMSEQEIKNATKKVNRDKLRRSITRALLPLQTVEDAFESSKRKVKRAIKKPDTNESVDEPLEAYGMKFQNARDSVITTKSRKALVNK